MSAALRLLLLENVHFQQEILQNQKHQEKIMSALSDGIATLQANDASLKDALAKLATDNAKAFSDLQAAISSGGDSADVAAAVAALGIVNSDLQAATASIQTQDAAALAADPANAAPVEPVQPTP